VRPQRSPDQAGRAPAAVEEEVDEGRGDEEADGRLLLVDAEEPEHVAGRERRRDPPPRRPGEPAPEPEHEQQRAADHPADEERLRGAEAGEVGAEARRREDERRKARRQRDPAAPWKRAWEE